MKVIALTQGRFALVDDEYYEFLNQWKWYAAKNNNRANGLITYYAVRATPRNEFGRQYKITMHQAIMGAQVDKVVDHIDHSGLNNQRYNLRFASYSQNCANRRHRKDKTSIYKGVSFHRTRKNWMAQIRIDNVLINLGRFNEELDAAIAYNVAAIRYFGEFASLNKIPK